MKSFKVLLLLLAFTAVSKAQGVKFDSDKISAGEKIKFTYHPKGTKLQGLIDINCIAYVFQSTTFPQQVKVNLTKEGDFYKAEVNTHDSTTLVGLSFFVGEQMDEAKNGYLLALAQSGKITAESYLNRAFLFSKAGASYLGLTIDAGKAAAYYKQAFEIKPALKPKYHYEYLDLAYKGDKVNGANLIKQDIDKLAQRKEPKEEDLILLAKLHDLLKQKDKSDLIKAAILKKYPLGNFAYSAAINAIPKDKSASDAEADLKQLISKFKLDPSKKEHEQKFNSIHLFLTYLYSKTSNAEKFDFYGSKMKSKVSAASFYNGYGNYWADKNENIAAAAEISKKSLAMIAEAKNGGLPITYASKADYIKSLDVTYGNYAHTYARLLYLQGKYEEALAIKEQAMSLAPSTENAISYVSYLMKNGQNEKAFSEAEKIIRLGKATPTLNAAFKSLYETLKKEESYELYVANLNKQASLNEQDEWLKMMVNIPAPKFSLVNLKGEVVSLANLKGKIIVLDYWATWCAPCIASFPGMQKAIEKYKNNPNVVFLFINTSQREAAREKIVKDYMLSTSYTFNVLMDERDERDLNKFKVRDLYNVSGIPAKFIIDAKGNIRFKRVGSSAVEEEILKELDMMITLASK